MARLIDPSTVPAPVQVPLPPSPHCCACVEEQHPDGGHVCQHLAGRLARSLCPRHGAGLVGVEATGLPDAGTVPPEQDAPDLITAENWRERRAAEGWSGEPRVPVDLDPAVAAAAAHDVDAERLERIRQTARHYTEADMPPLHVPADMARANLPRRTIESGGLSIILNHCKGCGEIIQEPGALLFGPPEPDGRVAKLHICVDCWDLVVAPFHG